MDIADTTAIPAAAATAGAASPIVLLLEDDPATFDAMRLLLAHYGFDVRAAHTVLDAIGLLRFNPQFALLDLMLPDGGGERVLELIRGRKMATAVAVLTACRDRDRLQQVARLKPDLILTKPIDFFRVLQLLRPAA